nr:hypothetical protein [uncultured Shimia sp.]
MSSEITSKFEATFQTTEFIYNAEIYDVFPFLEDETELGVAFPS